MIPKIIHYCWFGGNPLPEPAKNCIESWKRYCPEYEIKEWNETNFDLNCCDYVREAYQAKMWAFVSDYARFHILYHEGGLYFDTDVELIKPIEKLVEKGPFMGFELIDNDVGKEQKVNANPGLGLAVASGHTLYKEILDQYQSSHFLYPDGLEDKTTVVARVTEILKKYGMKTQNIIQLIEGIYIYPSEYFCPINYYTGKIKITGNTYAIHHYAASWLNRRELHWHEINIKIGEKFGQTISFKLRQNFFWRLFGSVYKNGVWKTFLKIKKRWLKFIKK